MLEYLLDEIGQQNAPPTPEAIEKLRLKQMETLQMLRRRLLEIHEEDKSAA